MDQGFVEEFVLLFHKQQDMQTKDTKQTKAVKQKVLVIYNQQCLLHTSSKPHPELPFRITAIIDALEPFHPHSVQQLIKQKQVKDIPNEVLQKLITSLQGQRYHQFIQYMWDQSYKKSEMYINTDTYYMKHTYRAALAAVKAVLIATQAIIDRTRQYAYAVVRPPGHHSGLKTQPHGFSFFNNVALAAEYALKSEAFKKIAIIDWDAHHGEGTQNLFYKRKDVLYISLHRHDNGKFFPHIPQSSSQNTGAGQGVGHNINICWNLPQKKPNTSYEREQSVGDQQYASAFKRIIMPVLQSYSPDLVLISCGFDSGDGDTIGNLKISKQGYRFMTQRLKTLKQPVLVVLEGGYNASVLGWGSQAVMSGLVEEKSNDISGSPNKIGEEGISKALQEVGKFWNIC